MATYMGPDQEMWLPGSWADVVMAAGSGILDETAWVELKKAIPETSKDTNLELARDLASLAVDGGTLIIGVKEVETRKGRANKAGEVVGVPDVAGLLRRIAAVANSTIRPPLVVHPQVFDHPENPELGVVVVPVDASSGAPHMVDGNYFARGSEGKRVLQDGEVRQILEANSRRRDDINDLLDAHLLTRRGHSGVLRLLMAPRAGRADVFDPVLQDPQLLQEATAAAAAKHPAGSSHFTVGHLRSVRLPDRVVFTNMPDPDEPDSQEDLPYTPTLMEVSASGTVTFEIYHMVRYSVATPGRPVIASSYKDVALHVIGVVAEISKRCAHFGVWDIVMYVQGLKGAGLSRETPWGTHSRSFPTATPYRRVVSATGAEMDENLSSVVDRLYNPLLVTLGVHG